MGERECGSVLEGILLRYRPNLKCEWLITAPTEKDKVGIKFQYWDLHPEYDHLEVEEQGEAEVAR